MRISPCVRLVGHGSLRDEWIDPLRVIYDHELMCFRQGGRCTLEFDGATFECPPNSYVIIPPGVWHVGRGRGRLLSRTWLHFDWAYQPLDERTPILTYAPATPHWDLMHRAPSWVPSDSIMQGPLHNPQQFFENHERLEELFNNGTPRERLACRGLLLEMLLSLLVADDVPQRERHGRREASRIRQALDRLAQHPFASAPSIREFLVREGKSYDHQARVFRTTYGVTPLQYVNSQRMERARNLLRDTPLPVSQVAYRLGFDDVVYFNRLFKKVVGMTPGQYRQGV